MGSETLALIERFYQATLEPDEWTAALEGMTKLLGADHTFLVVDDRTELAAPLVVRAGIDETDVTRLLSADTVRLLAPIMERLTAPKARGRALMQEELISDREFERTEFYNEILRPRNIYYGLTVFGLTAFGGVRNPWFQIAVGRTRSKGPFLQPEASALERLFPHLARAQRLHQRLEVNGNGTVGLAAVIERLAEAAVVLDADGRLLIANVRAEQILRERDGLALAVDTLQAATAALTNRLQHAIRMAATSATDHGQRLRLLRPGQRLPLLLDIAPLWRLGMPEPGMRSPRVIVFIKEPDAPLQIDGSALMETFRLTPRECEIVCMLAGGIGVSAIAARLQIRVGTVRQNLKNVFEKTTMRNQAALVALVRGFGR